MWVGVCVRVSVRLEAHNMERTRIENTKCSHAPNAMIYVDYADRESSYHQKRLVYFSVNRLG